MPGRDRTGPQGQGSLTGRGMGYCAGDDPAFGAPPPRGLGLGLGYRGGRGGRFFGRGRGFWAQPAAAPVDEKQLLQEQQSWLQRQLDAISNQLANMDKPINE
jgi:hypothetical protein